MNSERIPSLHARACRRWLPAEVSTSAHNFRNNCILVHDCRVAMTPWSATQAIGFTDAPPVAFAPVRQRFSFFRRFVPARCRVRLLHQAKSVHGSQRQAPQRPIASALRVIGDRGRPCASRVQQSRPSLALDVDLSAADRLRRAGPPPGLCFFRLQHPMKQHRGQTLTSTACPNRTAIRTIAIALSTLPSMRR